MFFATRQQRKELTNYIKEVQKRSDELEANIEKVRTELYLDAFGFKNGEIRERSANCAAPDKVLPCSHYESSKCSYASHCNFKQFGERT